MWYQMCSSAYLFNTCVKVDFTIVSPICVTVDFTIVTSMQVYQLLLLLFL